MKVSDVLSRFQRTCLRMFHVNFLSPVNLAQVSSTVSGESGELHYGKWRGRSHLLTKLVFGGHLLSIFRGALKGTLVIIFFCSSFSTRHWAI